jgi:hypothetical protein
VWFRSRSCFNDDDCLAGDFDACTNMAAAGKTLFADFKLTDKKQDSENSGDDSSEPDDKPSAKSCDRQPAEVGEQPSEGDRQQAAIRQGTIRKRYSCEQKKEGSCKRPHRAFKSISTCPDKTN